MKAKINIVLLIAVASLPLISCVEEEIKPTPPTVQTSGIGHPHSPIK